MIRAGSGLAKGDDAAEVARTATRAAAKELEHPTLAFVFASGFARSDVASAVEAARESARGATVVGASAGGVLSNEGEVEGESAVSVVAVELDDETSAEPFFQTLAGQGARDADALATRLAGKAKGSLDRSALLLFPDPLAFDQKTFFARLRERMGKLPVMGGLAAAPPPSSTIPVFTGRELASHAAAGVLLSGHGLRATVAVAQGVRPVTPAGRVTRSEKNLLFEVDGEPALERLKAAFAAVQARGGDVKNAAIFCGLGLDSFAAPVGEDDYLARNILGIDPSSGAVAVAELVPQGSQVAFLVRDAEAAREDLHARVRELKAARSGKAPAFGLYFNCLGRGEGLYGESGVDVSIVKEHLGDFPLGGFFGNGELAPFLGTNLVHNYTGVLVLVGSTN